LQYFRELFPYIIENATLNGIILASPLRTIINTDRTKLKKKYEHTVAFSCTNFLPSLKTELETR